MLPPMSRNLMPSNASVRVPMINAITGENGFSSPIELKHVRFVGRETANTVSQFVLSDGAAGVMYVDRVNTVNAFAIPIGSLVEIDGQEHYAENVFPAYELNGTVHHWEVELR